MARTLPVLALLVALPLAAPAAPESLLFQLENLDVAAVEASGYDVVVTDYSLDGAESGRLTSAQVATLRDGGRRTVLAHLSIGEAEEYRYYWDPAWRKSPPAWLGPENPDWPANHKVRYWHPEWRAILFGKEGDDGSFLDRILSRGFDGVYLDIIDAYRFWGSDGRDMADLVVDLAAYARARRPGFRVFVQNAPELGERYADYFAAVSGIGAEDSWFNGNRRRSLDSTRPWIAWLDMFRDAGKTVLVIDYPRNRKKIDGFYARAEAKGFVPLAAPRALDRMPDHARHVPGEGPRVVSVAPADDAEADAVPTFRWQGSEGAVEYRVCVAGEPSLKKVVTFRWQAAAEWTPSKKHGKKVLRLAAKQGHDAVWWWVTARDAEGRQRSGRLRKLSFTPAFR
jgi:cysteinyl-tRNA synthetase